MDRNREGRDDRDERRYDDSNEEGYGRAAMGRRDYSTSGHYFSEEEERGGRWGERTSSPYTERTYNSGGYGSPRHQDDFYTRGRALNRRHDANYGPSPSDNYERHAYGQQDRDFGPPGPMFEQRGGYARGEDGMERGRGPRGEWRRQEPAAFDRSRFDREDWADPRHDDTGRYGSGPQDIGRNVDEHYSDAYRRGQMRRGGYGEGGWHVPGPHSGRGPKGYQRSPERLRDEICERLTHHGYLDATEVEIRVEKGEVTLSGSVDSRQAKRLAEELAESVPGVKDVHNQLRIARTGGEGGDGQHAPAELGAQSRASEQPTPQGSTRGGRRGSQG